MLGPVLFLLYSQPLSNVITACNCMFHKYADDTELSKSGQADDFPSVVSEVETCIDSVQAWMNKQQVDA